MKVGIPKERRANENRVAATPETVKKLKGLGLDVVVEAGAGAASHFADKDYAAAGAEIGTQAQAQISPLIAVTEPGFASAASKQRNDDGGEEDNKILSGQRPAHLGAGKRRAVWLHPITSSARTKVAQTSILAPAQAVRFR